VTEFANSARARIRDFEKEDREIEDKTSTYFRANPTLTNDQKSNRWREDSAARNNLMQSESLEFSNNYVIPATEYRDELLRRLGLVSPEDANKFEPTIWFGGQIVRHPDVVTLGMTVNFLETLARRLPQ